MNENHNANIAINFVDKLDGSRDAGLSIIILSYERLAALAENLSGLLAQTYDQKQLEIILCNNSERVFLKQTRYSKLGRLLKRFADVKIINSSFNWKCKIRYVLATLAKYETVLFLDDDIIITEPTFLEYMSSKFVTLGENDILSCWNTIWKDCAEDSFSTISLVFNANDRGFGMIETDTVGAGICMFNKKLCLNDNILNMSPNFPEADDMGFPIIANLTMGSRSFYLPAYGQLKIHRQFVKNALCKKPLHYEQLYALYKSLYKSGYVPVMKRKNFDVRQYELIKQIKPVEHLW